MDLPWSCEPLEDCRCRSSGRYSVRNALPAQLAQVLVAFCDARECVLRLVVLDDVVLDPGFFGMREDFLPVDNAIADRSQVHRVAKVLPSPGADLGKFLEVLDVDQRESSRIGLEILQGVRAGSGDPAKVQFDLHTLGVA